MNSGDLSTKACSPPPITSFTGGSHQTPIHMDISSHSPVRHRTAPHAVAQVHHLGMDAHAYPPVPQAPFPGPRVTNSPPPTVPPQTQCARARLPGALYLGEGSYYGAFHNASKKDQVQFCSPRGIGEGSQVVQDLLHGWGKGVGSETHRCQLGTGNQNTSRQLQPPIPHPTEGSPSPAALPSLPGMGMPGAGALGEK